jgi:hypothetical protein
MIISLYGLQKEIKKPLKEYDIVACLRRFAQEHKDIEIYFHTDSTSKAKLLSAVQESMVLDGLDNRSALMSKSYK